MKRTLLLITILVFVVPAHCWAQSVVRDTIQVGDRLCLRSRVTGDSSQPMGIGDFIAATGGECLTFAPGGGRVYAYAFDRWLQRKRSPVDAGEVYAAPPFVQYIYQPPLLWALFHDVDGVHVRRVTVDGSLPLLDFVAIGVGEVEVDGPFRFDVRGDRVAVQMTGFGLAEGDWGVFVRLLTTDGVVLGPPTTMILSDRSTSSGVAITGAGTSACYHYWPTPNSIDVRARLRYSQGGFAFSPAIAMAPDRNAASLSEKLNGDELLFFVRNRESSTADDILQRFTPQGSPIGAPLAIPHVGLIRPAPDGRFVAFYPSNGVQLMKFYDAAWQPQTGLVPLVNEPVRAIQEIRAFAYTDDGTFWVSWLARDGLGADYYLTAITPIVPGDMNADGSLNNFDIDAFVAALVDRDAYHVAYPDVPLDVIDFLGDMNGDGVLNNFDIDPFVEALIGAP